jgi:hypothetical protein
MRYSSLGALAGSPSLGALASRRGLPPGLVHGWSLDNTTSGYVDFARGLALTQQGTGTSTAAGIIGDAASFNGNGWLQSASIAALPRIGFAVECWLYAANLTGTGAALSQNNGTSSATLGWLIDRSSASLRYTLFGAAGNASGAGTSITIAATTWYHAVMAYSSDLRVRGYLNGALIGTSDEFSEALQSTAGLVMIGARESAQVSRWAGYVDEPRIWQFGASGDPGAAFWAARHNGGVGRRP